MVHDCEQVLNVSAYLNPYIKGIDLTMLLGRLLVTENQVDIKLLASL